MADYILVHLTCTDEQAAFLPALLGEIGFESFEEVPQGLKAYAPEALFSQAELNDFLSGLEPVPQWTTERIEARNWNAEWEANYPPVMVENQVLIRAEFHEGLPPYPIEIVIQPRMSFGTGHHATTTQMVQAQLQLSHQGKRVMDAGTGTGVLAILAEKLGASYVNAFDIEDWTVDAARENAAKNNCQHLDIWHGSIEGMVPTSPFDIILANINRNVLMQQMGHYARNLVPGGYLLLSGFFPQDVPLLEAEAATQGLSVLVRSEFNTWACLTLQKGGA